MVIIVFMFVYLILLLYLFYFHLSDLHNYLLFHSYSFYLFIFLVSICFSCWLRPCFHLSPVKQWRVGIYTPVWLNASSSPQR